MTDLTNSIAPGPEKNLEAASEVPRVEVDPNSRFSRMSGKIGNLINIPVVTMDFMDSIQPNHNQSQILPTEDLSGKRSMLTANELPPAKSMPNNWTDSLVMSQQDEETKRKDGSNNSGGAPSGGSMVSTTAP